MSGSTSRRPRRPRPARAARAARRSLLALLLVAAATALAPATPAAAAEATAAGSSSTAATPFAGRSLAEALLALEERGLAIVFTSQLVRPEMTVASEPTATDPRRILDELLAPHGLRAEDGPGGTVVVVAAATGTPAGAIAGTVTSADDGRPLEGVRIRVQLPAGAAEATTAGGGRFEVAGLSPGSYDLGAKLDDFLPAELHGVEVRAGGSAEVTLALLPLPRVRDEIVVRSSRLSLLDHQPLAPLSLSRDDIESLPQLAGDVFRALSLLPGAAGNDVSAQVHLHGGRRDEVQVVLDGQELYEAYHLQDFDRALSLVAPESLGRASLVTGAFPADRGDRMSGVLDLTTRTPTGPPRTKLSLSLLNATAASGGSFGGERGAWLVSGRRGATDLAGRLIRTADPEFWDLFGKAGYRLGERHDLRLHALVAADSLGFGEILGPENKRWNTDYDTSYVWLTHDATVGSRLLVETTGSWSRVDRDRRGAEDEFESRFAVVDRRDFEVFGLAQEWSLQVTPRGFLSWGFEGRRYDTAYDYANEIDRVVVLSSPLAPPATGLTRFLGRFHGRHLAGYATGRFSPRPSLTVESGLRYDRHGLTDDTLISPRLSVAWRPGEASVVRLAWGYFFQSQRPYELQVEDGEDRFAQAERSEHWVVGYERRLAGRVLRALRIEAYRRSIDDPRPRYENLFTPQSTFPEVEPDRVRIAPDDSRAQGIELTLRGAAGARTEWWANYAHAVAEDRIGGTTIPRGVDQTHTLNLFASRRFGPWSLSAAWRFHTGWPTTPISVAEGSGDEEGEDATGTSELRLGRLDAGRLPDYHRLDLRASRQWRRRSGKLTFFVDLQNAYNRRNAAGLDLTLDDTGRPEIHRETWPGLVPSAGVSWEF